MQEASRSEVVTDTQLPSENDAGGDNEGADRSVGGRTTFDIDSLLCRQERILRRRQALAFQNTGPHTP